MRVADNQSSSFNSILFSVLCSISPNWTNIATTSSRKQPMQQTETGVWQPHSGMAGATEMPCYFHTSVKLRIFCITMLKTTALFSTYPISMADSEYKILFLHLTLSVLSKKCLKISMTMYIWLEMWFNPCTDRRYIVIVKYNTFSFNNFPISVETFIRHGNGKSWSVQTHSIF